MYSLSQICCLCFRNEVKLKLLQQTTCGDETFLQTANFLIPEIKLSDISHDLSVCEDCVNFVTEMHTFRQNCIENYFLLVKYIKLLGSSGQEIGNARIQLLDFKKLKMKRKEKNSVVNKDVKLENWIKTERVESESGDPVATVTKLHCDGTASDGEKIEEEMNYKIELNDDFNDKYGCKEELNDADPLEDILESQHSPEFQEDDSTSSTTSKFPEDTKSDVTKPRETINLYKCEICKRSLKTEKTFKRHVSTHDDKRKEYECKICGKRFISPFYLKSHNMIHTGEKPHKCETCGKRFTFKSSLNQHVSFHLEERPHACKTCGKRFTSSSILKKHAMVHTGEKPYKCDTCGKRFTIISNLKQHTLIHTGDKPYRCETCGKCFTLSGSLKDHLLIHTGEKPYECSVCGKRFRGQFDLNRHFMVHTGEKPHKCNVCGKSFRLASHLKQHEPIHFDDKPHKCDTCEKSFAARKDLTRHELSHSDVKLFECDLCEQSYTRADNLRKHKLKRHP